jgi:DNA-binding MarR family transcriptional regulator
MHELADKLAIERYNLTRLVDRLESEGLVTRARSAEDGRAAFATITDKGRELRKKMWKVYESTVAELFLKQFSVEEQRILASGLNNAARAVQAPKQPSDE